MGYKGLGCSDKVFGIWGILPQLWRIKGKIEIISKSGLCRGGMTIIFPCIIPYKTSSEEFLTLAHVRFKRFSGSGLTAAESSSCGNMSYSLNSLNGDYIGDYVGDYYRGY